MARLPRLSVPAQLHHIVHRGNNRQPIALDDEDRASLVQQLREHAQQAQVALHAYVLMPNHLHLLATPETAQGVPRMMQALGRGYVRQFNRRHGRSGTLFEGRYRSTLIEAERYLLPGMVYLDLNPVRAGLVAQAADWPWSSHGHYAGLQPQEWLAPPPPYWALGNTPFAREAAYANLVRTGLTDDERQALGRAVHAGWALGSPDFVAQLQRLTDRRLTPLAAGRPRKAQASEWSK